MSVLKTKVALENRLKTAFPSIPIAVEGVAFTPPQNDPYLYCRIDRNRVNDPVFGSAYRRESCTFQVFVSTPYNEGSSEAITIAEQIRDLFPRGLVLVVDNLRIQFFTTTQIQGTALAEGRVIVPVMVPVTVEVYA